MGTRLLTSEEISGIKKRLKEARKRQGLISRCVAELEQELEVGTCWCLDPEDMERIKREVAEIVKQDNERGRLVEVKMYGHELTGEERRKRDLGVYPKRVDVQVLLYNNKCYCLGIYTLTPLLAYFFTMTEAITASITLTTKPFPLLYRPDIINGILEINLVTTATTLKESPLSFLSFVDDIAIVMGAIPAVCALVKQ